MKVAVRCEVSSQRGAGHLTRCIALLQGLEDAVPAGVDATFLLDPTFKDRAQLVEQLVAPLKNCRVVEAHGNELAEVCNQDWIVVDHYDLGAEYEVSAKRTGARVLAIDDLVRPHMADVVLDQTFGRSPGEYRDRVPAECNVLTGSDYALLRREFRQARALHGGARTSVHAPLRILVSLGLSERTGLALRIAQGITAAEIDADVCVITGATDPFLEQLELLAKENPVGLRVITDEPDMCARMAWADLAVGAAGVTTLERMCLGLPSIVIQTADNQAGNIAAAVASGAALGLAASANSAEFHNAFTAILRRASDVVSIRRMSSAAAEAVDGSGAQRVGRAMFDVLATKAGTATRSGRQHQPLRLRAATIGDARLLFEWRNDPVTQSNFKSSTPVTWAEHIAWLSTRLSKSSPHLYVFEANNVPVGTLRIDGRSLSYTVAPEFRGQGVGAEMLSIAKDKFGSLDAEIRKNNEASIKVAQRAGHRVSLIE